MASEYGRGGAESNRRVIFRESPFAVFFYYPDTCVAPGVRHVCDMVVVDVFIEFHSRIYAYSPLGHLWEFNVQLNV